MSNTQYTHEQILSVVADNSIIPTREHLQSLHVYYMAEKDRGNKLQKAVSDLTSLISGYHPLIPQEEILRDLLFNILKEHGLQP